MRVQKEGKRWACAQAGRAQRQPQLGVPARRGLGRCGAAARRALQPVHAAGLARGRRRRGRPEFCLKPCPRRRCLLPAAQLPAELGAGRAAGRAGVPPGRGGRVWEPRHAARRGLRRQPQREPLVERGPPRVGPTQPRQQRRAAQRCGPQRQRLQRRALRQRLQRQPPATRRGCGLAACLCAHSHALLFACAWGQKQGGAPQSGLHRRSFSAGRLSRAAWVCKAAWARTYAAHWRRRCSPP